MKTDIRLTEMTERHLESVLKIEEASFFPPWSLRLFQDELVCQGAYNFVAHISGNQMIGYLCFRLIIDEMHIMRIAVNPSDRRRGYGAAMLHLGIEAAKQKGASACYLDVKPSNSSAVRMYQNAGFHCTGRRPRYYPETNEDGLIFMKQLKEDV